ncbi:unnamed protein product, partial [Heligmosomoides polygyrus]|uniref:Transposase_22 domain-containing protein n=1 Tax=Heligmosomoides polygyrus TaxID=6339 RepID=A0A183GXJ8_HELPZ
MDGLGRHDKLREHFTLSTDAATKLFSAVKDLESSKDVLVCVKTMLLLISAQISSILENDSRLREENAQVRQENKHLSDEIAKLEARLAVTSNSQEMSAINTSDHVANGTDSVSECERRRSIVLHGVPELFASNPMDKLCHDFDYVANTLSFVGVEAFPMSLYRMGKPTKCRLLKVILPSSYHQRAALRNAPSLRFSPFKGVYIRRSLTFEERKFKYTLNLWRN